MIGAGDDGFAGTRFADQGKGLTGVDVERNAPDGLNLAVVHVEVNDMQVFHGEQRGCHRYRLRSVKGVVVAQLAVAIHLGMERDDDAVRPAPL